MHWQRTVGEVLDRTERFPKKVRFTFSSRIDAIALDVLEHVVIACYGSGEGRAQALEATDLALTRLRVLLRLSHDRRYLDPKGYEHLARLVDEAGRMVGGWRRSER